MKKVICLLCMLVLLPGALTGCGSKTKAKLTESPRIYSLRDSEDIMPPSITLEEDGQFTFVFSALSSYIGRGSYEIKENRLVLNTDDGDFCYIFDMTDEGLVFDAEESSENTWYADLEDGAIFK